MLMCRPLHSRLPVCTAVAALACCLCLAAAEGGESAEERYYAKAIKEVEARLALWKPTKENQRTPRPELLHPKLALAGRWEINRGDLDFSYLEVKHIKGDEFAVDVLYLSCVTGWRLKRSGK